MNKLTQTISDPQMAILKSIKPINLFLAGVGSGKTFLAGIISYRFVSQFPECTGFIATNTFEQLNLSVLFRIREYWKSIGVTEWSKENPKGMYISGKHPPSHFNIERHNFESYNSIISFINGAIIFTGSLENSKAHEGKTFSWAILDETKDSRESDVKEIIIARMRQKGLYIKDGILSHEGEDFNPLYILTSPAKTEWLAQWFQLESYINEISEKIYSSKTFFQKEFANKFVAISSTYHNQDNLTKGYIQNILDNNTEDRGKSLIFANPFLQTGGEFYSSFSRLNHVTNDPKYKPEIPIHVSFDQNVVPYNSASIWQLEKINDRWKVLCVGEVALENPNNSTEEVCNEVLRRFGDAEGLFFYGDASGANRNVVSKEYRHHYQVIEKMFRKKLNNNSNRVLRRNPPLIKRREFVNKIFEGKLPIDLLIGNNCPKLMADLTYIKQDIDGTKKKEVVTNKNTGERYQKYGHLSDTMDYFLCAAFNTYFND